jgi:hypothetical protein
VKVHYASGTHPFQGWVNVDYEMGGEIQADLLQWPWPQEIKGVHDAYVGHFLEHLTREEGVEFLRRVRSRSIPGARLTVVGPDVVKAQRWVNRGAMSQEFLRSVGKHGEPRGNDRGAVHLWDSTGFEVVEMLKEAGWDRVKELPISQMSALVPGVPVIEDASWQFLIVAYADHIGN